MSTLEKFLTGAVAVAMLTTMLLPKRQTPAVIGAAGGAVSNIMSTVMGTSAPGGTKAVK